MIRPLPAALGTLLATLFGAMLAPTAAHAIDWSVLTVLYEDHRDWTVSATSYGFITSLEGKFVYDESSTPITEDTVGIDDYAFLAGEFDLQLFQKHHLRFAYIPFDFDGKGTLEEDIVFDGEDYFAGDEVGGKVEMHTYHLSYRYDIYLGQHFTISPILQASLIDVDGKVEDITEGESDGDDLLVPLPYVGLRAEAYPFARLGLFAEGKGFTIGKQATVWDFEGGAQLYLLRNLVLTGSYRLMDYDFDISDTIVEARIQGPFVGMTVRF